MAVEDCGIIGSLRLRWRLLRPQPRVRSSSGGKDDIANLGGQLTSVERELKSIRRDLDDLREKVENVSGFQKEIDHALERITAIEKHLGLDKKIAA
jgi:predicted  nucleic acid-binding Zn-ribbon protein